MKLHLIKDFKEICRLKLDSRLLNGIFKKAISFCGSKSELAFKFSTNWNNLYRYRTGRKYIPATIVDKLLGLLNDNWNILEGNIVEIKFNNGFPFKVIDQKLEVDFNSKEGAKVTAAILGDGYNRTGNQGAGYVNKNPILRKEFLSNLNVLFKCIELKDYSKAYCGKILQLPAFFSYVFEESGIVCGRKVFNNQGAPNWLLNSKKLEVISAYLQQIFDDEGHVSKKNGTIDIPQSVDVTNGEKVSKQLLDIYNLLDKVGIIANPVYNIGYYNVEAGNIVYKRARYLLTISSYKEIKKFMGGVGFLSREKQDRLCKIINTPTLIQRKNKQIEEDTLQACKKLLSIKEKVTSLALSNELGIGESYAQKLLKRLVKSGRINKEKEPGVIHKPNGDILKRTHAEFCIKGENNAV